jgi:hypothetical protein
MEKPVSNVKAILARAKLRVERLRAKGFTKEDFAKQFGKFLVRQDKLAEIRRREADRHDSAER